jgi:transposase InsO family protein
VITDQTVMNWLEDVRDGLIRLVRSRKPMNALPDLVRELSCLLRREWPRWGTRRIAGILARLGLKASRTSVQRILRRKLPRPAARLGHPARGPHRARHSDHIWLVDFTEIRGFFRSVVVGAVLDAFSRKVLALRVWGPLPDAAGACLLVRDAMRTYGKPRWLVSDRGAQFRSTRFKSMLARRGIRRRFASLGDTNLSRIDRFWRAMKAEFGRGLLLFRPIASLERELRGYALWHGRDRPHQGLRSRVPDDVYRGRSRRRRLCDHGVLEIRFVLGDRRLPIFQLRPAA